MSNGLGTRDRTAVVSNEKAPRQFRRAAPNTNGHPLRFMGEILPVRFHNLR